MNSPEKGKVLKIDFMSELFLNPFRFKLKFSNFSNLNERVDALCYHSSFVICDHQWRPRLPSCGAELSPSLKSADSAGRVVRVGRIGHRFISLQMSLGVFTFCDIHGVVPLFEEILIEVLIASSIVDYIFQGGRL